MYLSHVHIKNFRNLSDLKVEFRKGLTVVVGENNVGKSNVADAIKFALGSASTGSIRTLPNRDDITRNSGASGFSVDLIFSELSPEECGQFLECLNYNKDHPEESTVEIHYTWTWNEGAGRYSERRYGGPLGSDSLVPSEVLQSLPFVYLEPLRDALSTLTAGRSNRIGSLIRRLAAKDEPAKVRIKEIFNTANESLEEEILITKVAGIIQKNILNITSEDLGQSVGLRASTQEFESIVNNLRLVLKLPQDDTLDEGEEAEESSFDYAEIRENGLGYNNILYIATIVAELSNLSDTDHPILLVEEPEAHLHPQLQLLLGEYFRTQSSLDGNRVQIILTTHSPNLTSQLAISSLNVLHRAQAADSVSVVSAPLWKLGLGDSERRKLQRMLDVTKASIFFAKSILAVEGISEELLIPALAQSKGFHLADKAITVVSLGGLPGSTFRKLFREGFLRTKCAILTDSDPNKEVRPDPICADLEPLTQWRTFPVFPDPGAPEAAFPDSLHVFKSSVTFEYDLALPSGNAQTLTNVWRDRMGNKCVELSSARMSSLEHEREKATFFWQASCLHSGGRYKAAFAHEVAECLESEICTLSLPGYILESLTFLGLVASEVEG